MLMPSNWYAQSSFPMPRFKRPRSMIKTFLIIGVFCGWSFAEEDAWLNRYKNLDTKSTDELAILRNEIYARHGRPFKSPKWQQYFVRMPWYKADSNYSDSRLSQRERELERQIARIENGHPLGKGEAGKTAEAADKYLSDIRSNLRPGQGIPSTIGGIQLGSKNGLKTHPASFFGFEGNVGAITDPLRNVIAVVFDFNFTNPELNELQLPGIISTGIGFEPVREYDNFVWRDNERTLRFVGANTDLYKPGSHLYLHSSESTLPGNPNDGFNDFIAGFYTAMAETSADSAIKYFIFPLGLVGPHGHVPSQFDCATEDDFKKKFEIIRSEIGVALPPGGEIHFIWPDYWIPANKILHVRLIEGRWKISEFYSPWANQH
jgi:hypothetical protein